MARILILAPQRLVWVAVAKAASMVIQTTLLEKLGLPYARWREAALCSIAEVARRDGHFRFAFVRDPWARLYSCYLDKIIGPSVRSQPFILGDYGMRAGMSFEAFVRRVAEIDDADADEHFVSQSHTLSHEGRLAVDYVGRFENLPGDWDRLRPLFDLPELPWRPVGTSRARFDFQYHCAHYTPELAAIVARRYAADLETFGYRFA